MNYSILRTKEQLETLLSEWPALLKSSPVNSVFLTYDWIISWLDSREQRKPQLLTIAVRDSDGRLAGIAPFYKTQFRLLGALPIKALQVLGDVDSGAEYGNIITRSNSSPIVCDQICEALGQCKNEWDIIYFGNVASWRSENDKVIQMLAAGPFAHRSRPRSFAACCLAQSYDAYMKSLSRNMRSQIKRKTKNFLAEHPIEFEEVETADVLRDAMAILFSLHEARWQVKQESGSFNRNPVLKRFYEIFLPRALNNGWLRIFSLRSTDSTIAVQYGLSYEGVFSQVQEGFNPVKHSGAGNVLRNHVIQQLIEEGHAEYDFLGGFTEHKRRWGARERIGSDYIVTNNSAMGRLLRFFPVWPTGRYMHEHNGQ